MHDNPPPTGARLTRDARLGLFGLAASVFAAVTTEMLPIGLLPDMGQSLGRTEAQTGLLVGLYAAMVAALSVPLAAATRRVPRKRLLMASIGCYALSNLVCAVAPDFTVLAVGRVIGGATHALFFAVAIGYGARLVPPSQTGRALALVSAGVSVGFVAGVPLATALGNAAGWRAAFWALFVVLVLVLALLAKVLPDLPATSEAAGVRRGRARDLATVVTSNSLAFVGHFALYTYVSALLLQAGAAPSTVALGLLVFGVAGLVGVLVGGPWLDRSPRGSALVILGLVAVGVLGVAVGYPSLGWVVAAGILWNGAWGPVPSLYQVAAVRTRATSPELAGAWINATSNVGIALGAILGGRALESAGIEASAWVALALLIGAAGIVAAARRSFPDRAAPGRHDDPDRARAADDARPTAPPESSGRVPARRGAASPRSGAWGRGSRSSRA